MNQEKRQEPLKRSHHVVITTANEDEVSLIEIVMALRRQWKFIGAVTFGVTLAVLIVILQMSKVYRAEVVLLPPKASDVALFNIPDVYASATSEEGLYIYTTTTEDLYASMLLNLRSNSLRYQFFRKHGLYDELKEKGEGEETEYTVFRDKFNELLQVKDGGARKESLEYVTVTLDGANQDRIAKWLNDFVDFVDTHTVNEVVNTIGAKVRVKKTSLRERISSLREAARNKRENEIVRLTEKLRIASKIEENRDGFENNSLLGSVSDDMKLSSGEYAKEINLIKAEIETLKSRKSDDPYIEGLAEVQEQLIFWTNLHVQDENVHAARIDKQAGVENNVVRPKGKLMLILGFVLGLIMAVFIAVARFLITRQHLAEESVSERC